MDFSKMILTEHLVETIVNNHGEHDFDLVFKMDNEFYTGNFLKYDEHNRVYNLTYNSFGGYNKNYDSFSIDYRSTSQDIRNAFFEFAFGPEKSCGDITKYVSLTDMVLRDIITFVEQYDSEFLNPIVKNLKCIYNLNNINTGKKLDFYMVSNETMSPISLIKQA